MNISRKKNYIKYKSFFINIFMILPLIGFFLFECGGQLAKNGKKTSKKNKTENKDLKNNKIFDIKNNNNIINYNNKSYFINSNKDFSDSNLLKENEEKQIYLNESSLDNKIDSDVLQNIDIPSLYNYKYGNSLGTNQSFLLYILQSLLSEINEDTWRFFNSEIGSKDFGKLNIIYNKIKSYDPKSPYPISFAKFNNHKRLLSELNKIYNLLHRIFPTHIETKSFRQNTTNVLSSIVNKIRLVNYHYKYRSNTSFKTNNQNTINRQVLYSYNHYNFPGNPQNELQDCVSSLPKESSSTIKESYSQSKWDCLKCSFTENQYESCRVCDNTFENNCKLDIQNLTKKAKKILDKIKWKCSICDKLNYNQINKCYYCTKYRNIKNQNDILKHNVEYDRSLFPKIKDQKDSELDTELKTLEAAIKHLESQYNKDNSPEEYLLKYSNCKNSDTLKNQESKYCNHIATEQTKCKSIYRTEIKKKRSQKIKLKKLNTNTFKAKQVLSKNIKLKKVSIKSNIEVKHFKPKVKTRKQISIAKDSKNSKPLLTKKKDLQNRCPECKSILKSNENFCGPCAVKILKSYHEIFKLTNEKKLNKQNKTIVNQIQLRKKKKINKKHKKKKKRYKGNKKNLQKDFKKNTKSLFKHDIDLWYNNLTPGSQKIINKSEVTQKALLVVSNILKIDYQNSINRFFNIYSLYHSQVMNKNLWQKDQINDKSIGGVIFFIRKIINKSLASKLKQTYPEVEELYLKRIKLFLVKLKNTTLKLYKNSIQKNIFDNSSFIDDMNYSINYANFVFGACLSSQLSNITYTLKYYKKSINPDIDSSILPKLFYLYQKILRNNIILKPFNSRDNLNKLIKYDIYSLNLLNYSIEQYKRLKSDIKTNLRIVLIVFYFCLNLIIKQVFLNLL